MSWDVPADIDAVWCDPARRDEGERRLPPGILVPAASRALALGRALPAPASSSHSGIELAALPSYAEFEFRLTGSSLGARRCLARHIAGGRPHRRLYRRR